MDKYIKAVKDFFDRISDSYILNPTKKTITLAFCVLIVIICIASAVFVIGDISGEPVSTSAAETTDSLSVALPAQEKEDFTANILFALEGSESLELLGVMRLSSQEKTVRVSFLNAETYCSFNNLSGTMNEHYENGGSTELVWAVGEYAGISIERFIIADYTSFKSMLNEIGDMNVVLEHEVVCGQDAASLVIEKGPQTLIPEMMTKYFGYLCENTDLYGEEIAGTMMSYGEKLFCTDDEKDIEKNFFMLLSTFMTDISAQDFVRYKTAVKGLADKAVLSGVTVEENMSEMK